ncbi:ATP-binding protein [Amnibacterium flavum]|uniref:ATP-binding protein n=1 Tax=Amnibacterium flavum TaxID=2173173 RepID=A0A2V1HVN1_9MICO|nr:ATP-binding protein [Amnibacterium flavum]PVZ96411.1 ATP-binding protein [Amnibacterium flavum]
MIARTLEFSVPPADVDTVHQLLEEVWTDAPPVDIMDRYRFETALVELASNVMRHADDGSGLACVLTVEVSPRSLRACLLDSGIEGDVDLDREMPPTDDESGRGIPLIRALVDRVEYSRADGVNRWEIHRALLRG